MSDDDAPDIREGDTVVFTSGGRTETTVTDAHDDGSFFVEWHDSRGRHAQIFRPSVFTRDGRNVEHEPAERQTQSTLEGVAEV